MKSRNRGVKNDNDNSSSRSSSSSIYSRHYNFVRQERDDNDNDDDKNISSSNAMNKISNMDIRAFVEVGMLFFLLGIVISWYGVDIDGISNNINIYGQSSSSSLSSSSSSTRSRNLQSSPSSESTAIDMSGIDGSVGSDSNNIINDDITRDETCKKYLKIFLNGTTDATDECTGMYHAYKAGDCVDDTKIINSHGNGNKNYQFFFQMEQSNINNQNDNNTNTTVNNDDVLIDDFYENWECCSSIYDYYSTKCQETSLDSSRLLGIVIVLVFCGFAKSLIRSYESLQPLPDAAACTIVGAIAGLLIKVFDPSMDLNHKLAFNNDLFLHILLPPIVFQAALTIDKKSFRKHLFPILSLAIFGTFISAICIGFIIYYLSIFMGAANATAVTGTDTVVSGYTSLPLIDSLLFGALISSIDPVATLGILASVGVSQRDTLYTLVFGESLLNDGVAIVLFDTLVNHLNTGAEGADTTSSTIKEIIHHFFSISFGSIFIGLLCGVCCTLYFSSLKGKHSPVTEVSIFFTWALIPFYLSDGFKLSGIISVMVMGFVLDYFVIGGFQSNDNQRTDYIEFQCHQDDELVNLSSSSSSPPSPPSSTNIGDNEDQNGTTSNNNNSAEINVGGYHQYYNTRTMTRKQQICRMLYKSFNGKGHLLSHSRQHVGFVAEVISTIMETAIFAYLGLFLFNDNNTWDFRLNTIAIFSCIASRAFMILIIGVLINIGIYFDCERILLNGCGIIIRNCWNKTIGTINGGTDNYYHYNMIDRDNNNNNNNNNISSLQINLLSDNTDTNDDDNIEINRDTINNDNNNTATNGGTSTKYLDYKTQLILLLSGVRGAVSFALVCNIPVYDAVTKEGSMYKAQLKAMTSTSIIFTIFIFGILTYFTVHKKVSNDDDNNNDSNHHRGREILGHEPLQTRLLGSDNGSRGSSSRSAGNNSSTADNYYNNDLLLDSNNNNVVEHRLILSEATPEGEQQSFLEIENINN